MSSFRWIMNIKWPEWRSFVVWTISIVGIIYADIVNNNWRQKKLDLFCLICLFWFQYRCIYIIISKLLQEIWSTWFKSWKTGKRQISFGFTYFFAQQRSLLFSFIQNWIMSRCQGMLRTIVDLTYVYLLSSTIDRH